MSIRRTFDVLRPHLWSVGVPMAWLIVGGNAWIAATVAIGPAVEHLPWRAQLVGHVAAGTGFTTIASWLALRFRRAVTQGHRDQEAAELLDLLRLEALQPGTVLLEIHDVQWTSRSGQRVWAVDVLTGEVSDRWIPGPGSEPVRSFSYASRAGGPSTSLPECRRLPWRPPTAIAAGKPIGPPRPATWSLRKPNDCFTSSCHRRRVSDAALRDVVAWKVACAEVGDRRVVTVPFVPVGSSAPSSERRRGTVRCSALVRWQVRL